ncbi:hypothetical protein [Amycolatopsis decaplanina]|uniref:Uncharacterized protein n=1 Tax=Amycolatopsis decaplanina DSM 44594 TaxID=1284240 RepID=M2YDQ5_9PSEU|nr:hypothetical protein [Amycolatopsis decaplanina]EME53002.1 hypothetical protein H074_31817 [Amycolatopsis decaplanina DSM 44594]
MQLFWVGPVEFVVLDVLRTGRVGTEAVVFSLAAFLATLTSARLAVGAGLDLLARSLFLPSHIWSSIMLAVDLAVLAATFFSAGRAGRGKGNR